MAAVFPSLLMIAVVALIFYLARRDAYKDK